MCLKIKSLLCPLAFLFVVSGCQESVFQSLKKTDDLFVYEGLPHPLRENPTFEKEMKRDDVMQINDHWFYDAKTKATGNNRDQLMNLLFDESGFSSNVIPKDCGFHPDYAIVAAYPIQPTRSDGWKYSSVSAQRHRCPPD